MKKKEIAEKHHEDKEWKGSKKSKIFDRTMVAMVFCGLATAYMGKMELYLVVSIAAFGLGSYGSQTLVDTIKSATDLMKAWKS